MHTPILGSAYVARSVNAANNRMVNLFPEITPEAGKEAGFLSRAPGLRLLSTIGTGPIRGINSYGGNMYVVSGSTLYKVDSTYTATTLGTVSGDVAPVSMANNGNQLFVACNGPSYVYNSTTNAFAAITDVDFTGALTVSYLDGYFVYIQPNSQLVWVTALLDPTSIDPLDFASAEGNPDNLISSVVNHSEVWLFGTNSIEVWYNAGSVDFPLQRIQGAFNELGCAATFSVAKLDNSIFWLGADARGKGIVYKASGYIGARVSTHAIEWQIQQYSRIDDAVAYSYQQDGHSFYVLTFPTANATWVYDAATQAWHERAGWLNGSFLRHRSNCQTAFNGEVIVGDYQNGNIYAFDMNVFADHNRQQKWLRSWRALPTGQNNLKRTAHHTLQLDCETGVGLVNEIAVDWEQVSIGILQAVVGFEPGTTIFNELFSGRKLGDVDNTGTVELIDSIIVLKYNANISINAAELNYIENTLQPILLGNTSKYSIYLTNAFQQGINPQIMLRWSDDGGHTWSREHWADVGLVGEYSQRVFWRRLGMTLKLRDRVYEISGTDPVRTYIMGAELLISPTNA